VRLAYHAASVHARTRLLVALMLALALAGVACTGDGTTSTSTTTSQEPTASELPTSNVAVTFVEGEYVYENNGVSVTFSWKSGTGTLKVDNGSGFELGPPSLYAITPTQERVDATVADASPIADGATLETQVTFPASLKAADAGLIAIVFGDQNWGALSPKVIEK
jgi:hypothetical protein